MSEPVYIVKRPNVVQFNVMNFARFLPFNFIVTENDQELFTFPASALAAWVYVNGTAQNGDKDIPDFTIDGVNLLMSAGLEVGDNVYGMIQY